MSTDAYIGVGTNENQETFFSAAHGTGKGVEKTSKIPSSKEELFAKMKDRGVKLYNAKSSKIIEQDAGHYKDPTVVVEGMVANKIMKAVAKMKPVAVLMY
jgi:RNA-splicing ligase RtcB